MSVPDFVHFLDQHRVRVEPMEIEAGDAWWQANIAASPEADTRAAVAQKTITRVYADRETYEFLNALDPSGMTPDQRRQHMLLLNAYTGNQMDDAVIEDLVNTERRVESTYNSFRPLLGGEPVGDNALRDILRDSPDADERRSAWTASKEIGRQVEADVLHLVALRNAEARRLGYANYYQMSLALQELDQDTLFALLERAAGLTEGLYAEYKSTLDAALAERFGISESDLRPWHYGDPFFQEAPAGEVDLDRYFDGADLEALTRAFYGRIGLEIKDILGRSDLYERDNKCQHAFCIHVGRYEDVRVLCNCTSTERWMGTMLHEFGHAVYDKYLGDDLPFFLRDTAHILTTEAIAMLFGRLSRNPSWLREYAGVPADEAQAVGESARREQAAQLLVFTRWCLVMTHFERSLYENPDQDLNGLWWDLVRRYQRITPPEGRDAPDWAAKIHLATSPVYYHNYLLGEMFASQLLDYLREHVIDTPAGTDTDVALVTSPAVGAYLRDAIFSRGARLRWDDLIAAATGEPLDPAHFVGHLTV